MQAHYFAYQAGANCAGDCDQIGRPVQPGLWYVAAQVPPPDEDPGEAACTVAGPFTKTAARVLARDLNRFQVPTPEESVALDGAERISAERHTFASTSERDRWLSAMFPDRECGEVPGSYHVGSRTTLDVDHLTVTVATKQPATYPGA